MPEPTDKPEWLTIPEIARRLRVGQMTVYRLAEHGELVTYRIGKQFRVKASDFDAYLAAAKRNQETKS